MIKYCLGEGGTSSLARLTGVIFVKEENTQTEYHLSYIPPHPFLSTFHEVMIPSHLCGN